MSYYLKLFDWSLYTLPSAIPMSDIEGDSHANDPASPDYSSGAPSWIGEDFTFDGGVAYQLLIDDDDGDFEDAYVETGGIQTLAQDVAINGTLYTAGSQVQNEFSMVDAMGNEVWVLRIGGINVGFVYPNGQEPTAGETFTATNGRDGDPADSGDGIASGEAYATLDARDGTVTGSAGNDTIDAAYSGDPDGDQVDDGWAGGAGTNDNVVDALGGDDLVQAGLGSDTVFGGSGNDTLDGGDGDDSLVGGDGDDSILGQIGNDILEGGIGADTLDGGAGNDTIYGGDDGDSITGGSGDDIVYTGTGADTVETGEGSDIVYLDDLDGDISNVLTDSGSTGTDTIVLATGSGTYRIQGDFSASDGFEVIDGSGATGDFLGTRDAAANFDFTDVTLIGVDEIGGTASADTIIGSAGADSITGAAGTDSIDGGAGSDTLIGGDGADTIGGGSGADSIDAGAGDDVVYASSGSDSVETGEGSDAVFLDAGSASNDLSDSGLGVSDVDTIFLNSGAGIYSLEGDFSASDGFESITGSTAMGEVITTDDAAANFDFFNVTLTNVDEIRGTSNADNITASAGADFVTGLGGDDMIFAGDGDDTIEAGDDADTVYGGAGADLIEGGGGNDNLLGDDFSPSGGNDTLIGGAGDDTLNGAAGDDQLTGGDGNDLFLVSDGNDIITDFGAGETGAVGDGDIFNNDFLNLIGYYDNLDELRADQDDDGILNQSNALDDEGNTVDYSDNTQFGSNSMTVQGASGSSYSYDNTGIVCFTSGTMILTPRGEVQIDSLKPGDLVCTLDNGPQPIEWIGRRHCGQDELRERANLRPILIPKGVLGGKRDLLVSRQHGMLIGQDNLARAIHLTETMPGVRIANGKREVTYIHLMFEAHQIIFAEGAPSESFYPGPMAMQMMSRVAIRDLNRRFPRLLPTLDKPAVQRIYGDTARSFLKKKELPELLVAA